MMPKLVKAYKLNLKRRILLFSLPVLILLAGVFMALPRQAKPQPLSPKPLADKVKVVVIDPGHGGHDTGCLGSKGREKDVALAVSLKLGKLIEDNFPDVKVVYTRKTDVFIELYRRAQIANLAKADLFICIHCNSGPKAAYGAETFVMGLHKTEGNLDVAKRENATILLEDDYDKKYEGYDPNSAEADIIFSLFQSAYLDRSLTFAGFVQDQLRNHAKRYDRKVKQAGFLVLWKTSMPSVLIETGFLTNDSEHDFLTSKTGQETVANSIYRAFTDYKSQVDGVKYTYGTAAYDTFTVKVMATEPVIPVNVVVKDTVVKKAPPIKIVPEKEPVKSEPVKSEPVNITDKGVLFRVQFYNSASMVGTKSTKFKGLPDVYEYKDGTYKYTSGKFTTFNEAVKHQSKVRAKGFADAFVVVFKDGKRQLGADAKKYMK